MVFLVWYKSFNIPVYFFAAGTVSKYKTKIQVYTYSHLVVPSHFLMYLFLIVSTLFAPLSFPEFTTFRPNIAGPAEKNMQVLYLADNTFVI